MDGLAALVARRGLGRLVEPRRVAVHEAVLGPGPVVDEGAPLVGREGLLDLPLGVCDCGGGAARVDDGRKKRARESTDAGSAPKGPCQATGSPMGSASSWRTWTTPEAAAFLSTIGVDTPRVQSSSLAERESAPRPPASTTSRVAPLKSNG